MFDAATRNIRYALRTLAHTPGFTVTVVLTLALAIGANTTVFSALDAVLLEPLPFPYAGRLVEINQTRAGTTQTNIAPVRLEDWDRLNSTFEALTGYLTQDASETSADRPQHLRVASVSPHFNEVWGIAPALGRGFAAGDHENGAELVALITDRWWRTRFAADPGVLNRTVRIDGVNRRIVGVMPASFAFPERSVDIWLPAIRLPYLLNRNNAWYQGEGRLKPGVTLEQARADLELVQKQLAAQYPDPDAQIGLRLDPFVETAVGGARGSLWLLFGAVSVLLLIASTNIAALLLSRATRRRREMTVRLVLGSSQWSVAAQLLTEVTLLALAGALLGLAIVAVAPPGLRALAPNFPRIDEIAVDGRILVYTLGSVAAVTVLCGLLPAFRGARESLRGTMADAGRSNVATRHSLQWLFVGVQVALSVTLLAGAGLLVRSFQELWRVERGFEPAHVLSFRVTGSYAEGRARMIQDVESLIAELPTIRGVEAAATSSPVPGVLNDGTGFDFGAAEFSLVEPTDDADLHMVAEGRSVSPTYFDTMQIPLLSGDQCRRNTGQLEVMVNRAFATRYLAGGSAVGLHLKTFTPSTIVGVVGDAREYGLAREPVPTVYYCETVIAFQPLAFLVRTSGDPNAMIEAVRTKLAEIQPQRSMFDVMPLEQRMGDEYAQNRLRTILLAMFAGTALALTVLGVYGTLSYVVGLRRREIGLRLAVGAAQRDIVTYFVRKALGVVGVALVAGLALSLALGRVLAGMLFGVSAADPVTLGAVIVLVVGVALLAAFLPALRASRIDPMHALREE